MKYTKIILSSATDVTLPIAGYTGSEPFILKNVDGLGPPEIDVFLINSNADNPAFYQGRRPQNRQLVIQVGLNPDFSTGQNGSDLRAILYGLLLNNQTFSNPLTGSNNAVLKVKIADASGTLMSTDGYISKIEVVPFSKDPEVQITIDCTSPYLEGPDVNCIADWPNITNIGNAPSGFRVQFSAPDQGHFNMQQVTAIGIDLSWVMGPTYDFVVDTRPGKREITLLNTFGGPNVNLLGYVTDLVPFGWIMLFQGLNEIHVAVATTEYDGIPKYFIPVSCIYTPRYWGI